MMIMIIMLRLLLLIITIMITIAVALTWTLPGDEVGGFRNSRALLWATVMNTFTNTRCTLLWTLSIYDYYEHPQETRSVAPQFKTFRATGGYLSEDDAYIYIYIYIYIGIHIPRGPSILEIRITILFLRITFIILMFKFFQGKILHNHISQTCDSIGKHRWQSTGQLQ